MKVSKCMRAETIAWDLASFAAITSILVLAIYVICGVFGLEVKSDPFDLYAGVCVAWLVIQVLLSVNPDPALFGLLETDEAIQGQAISKLHYIARYGFICAVIIALNYVIAFSVHLIFC